MNYFLLFSLGFFLFFLLILRYNPNLQLIKKKSKTKRYQKNSTKLNSKDINKFYLSKNGDLLLNNHFFSQKKVVITGDFVYFKTRNELAKLLWESGAIIETNLNTSTDILIVGKFHIDSLKVNYAFYLNTKILTEQDLLSYYPDLKPQSLINE